MMKDNRPKVFVSSTIYDFKDLRSAIRFWLEETGFQVLFSEFNDFPQNPDSNSYESCIQAIDDSDYFVLLIGSRVGGLYGPDNISITRKEYRHAYERLKSGRIKIIPFVRKEIWDIREDRKALQVHLQGEAKLDPETAKQVANHPSKLVEDAGHVFDFLNEIGRNHEMKKASQGETALPIGNWIYQFASFGDIIDALRTVMRVRGHLRKAALVANLKLEIARNMRRLYASREVYGSKYIPMASFSGHARSRLQGGHDDCSSYKGSELGWLGTFVICSMTAKDLEEFALHEAAVSGEFLDFDVRTGLYTPGKFQAALLDTIERIRLVNLLFEDKQWFERGIKLIEEFKHTGDTVHSVRNARLVMLLAAHDRICDLYDLFIAIYKALNGDGSFLETLKIRPLSPTESDSKVSESHPPLESIIEMLEK